MSVAIKYIDCLPMFVHTLILERSHVVAMDITRILKHVVEYLRLQPFCHDAQILRLV